MLLTGRVHGPCHSPPMQKTSNKEPWNPRGFLADTTALIIFFTFTGALNERYISGMSWEDVGQARLLGAALMVPVARPYGM